MRISRSLIQISEAIFGGTEENTNLQLFVAADDDPRPNLRDFGFRNGLPKGALGRRSLWDCYRENTGPPKSDNFVLFCARRNAYGICDFGRLRESSKRPSVVRLL